MTGGKLAAYRLMAEDAADRLCAALGVEAASRTAQLPLPGGEAAAELPALAARFRIGLASAARLAFRHGARARGVLEAGDDVHARCRRIVCACEPVLDAELRHVARSEGLRRLTDCTLRVRLGVGACQGAGCAATAAGVLAEELGWDAARAVREVAELAAARWRAVAPVLAGAQVGAMELHRHVNFGMLGLAEEILP
jgi:glycerol-3-phosphate dehydrogenase